MDKDKYIKDELKEISPFLSEKLSERKGGFKMPEGYLESLSDRIMDKVEEEGSSKVVGIDSHTLSRANARKTSPFRYVAAAASIALIIVSGIWIMNANDNSSSSYAEIEKLERYNEAEVLQYLDSYMNDIEFGDLVESGVVTDFDIDFNDISEFSEEDADIYINAILEKDLEDI